MNNFQSYQIIHFALENCNNWNVPQGNTLLYFWWHEKALAHIWLEPEKEWVDSTSFKKKLIEAIQPAISQSLHRQNKQDLTSFNWQKCVNDDNFNELISFLNELYNTSRIQLKENISVVVCTRNRTEALRNCLAAIEESVTEGDEIIVVDNAPSDNFTELVVANLPKVRYIKEPRKGLDIARNTGAMAARNQIIAYTDDDVLVSKTWANEIRNCFEDKLTMAATGLIIPETLTTKTQYIFERYWGFNRGYCEKIFDHQYFMNHIDYGVPVWEIGAGANMAFRKSIFDLVGYFDERLDAGASGCSGDSEFWYRILAEGWNIFYQPDAYVYHHHRTSEKDLQQQLFSYMRGQVSSLLVQYETYGHVGNLKRAMKHLPNYYFYRFKNRLLQGKTEDFTTIFTEIKGCISGLRYYRQHKEKRNIPFLKIDQSLYNPVIINDYSLVSVIITAYNYGEFIEQAIKSVLNQTHQNIEIIVVDDGSADNTSTILSKYPQVKKIHTNRVGLAAARNMGTQLSKGDFLLFLDADDYLLPDGIEQNLKHFKQFPNAAYVSGAHLKQDENENYLQVNPSLYKEGDVYAALLQGNYIGMEATVLYRKELFFTFHFEPKLAACEDYDINLRIARHLPVYSHREFVAVYRIHKKNMSSDNSKMLQAATKVLQQQIPYLNSQNENEALHAGLENWKKYYTQPLKTTVLQ